VILAVSDWAVLLVEFVTLKYTQHMPLVGGMKIQLFDVAPEKGVPVKIRLVAVWGDPPETFVRQD
jgi:hypothetical protein